jgi:hypothetical protein
MDAPDTGQHDLTTEDQVVATLTDLNVSGWRVASEHGCDGTEEVCSATRPIAVQVEVSPREIATAMLSKVSLAPHANLFRVHAPLRDGSCRFCYTAWPCEEIRTKVGVS